MSAATVTTLARALRGFFTQYLSQVRGASPHTVRSYRDSLALLLRFAGTHRRTSVARLDLDGLSPDVVLAFLTDLEHARRNRSSTRNVRLAAIHAFFRYVASAYPEHLEDSQRILAIPFKRSATRVIQYLDTTRLKPRSPPLTGPPAMDDGTMPCSPRCLTRAPVSKRSSISVRAIFSWSHRRMRACLAKVERSASVRSGRRRRNYCARTSGSAG